MSLQRAYSLLRVKALDVERRTITGTATTPTPDRMGDIVEPLGVKFANPLPLLLYHNSQKPVGTVKFSKPTKDGIEFEATIPALDEPGTVKDRLDEAWQSVKAGLIAGVSIGFRSIKEAYDRERGGFDFLETEVLELSLVAIPANPDATIATVKSFDLEGQAAYGHRREIVHTPGATGTPRVVRLNGSKEQDPMKKISEQKAGFVSERTAKVARLNLLNEKAEGSTLDAAQQDEFDTLTGEIDAIDKHIARLDKLEEINAKAATTVPARTPVEGSESRDQRQTSRIITMRSNAPAGVRFARMAMCIAVSKGSRRDAMDYAAEYYSGDEGIVEAIKTAVGGATTANGSAPLLQYTDIVTEFIDYLRPLTILGKFGTTINGVTYPSLTRVPFNVRVGTQTAGASGSWVGEGKPAPLSKGTFSTATLDFAKLATIAVLTKEEVRFASPSAELKVRNDLAKALIAKADSDLIDPANAGTANVKPAAITYGIAATAVSNTTAAAFRVDLKNMLATMIAAGIQPSGLTLIMSQGTALSLSLMRNSLGNREFPDMTMNGGMCEGIPVIASEHATGLGSPSTNMIVAVNATDVFLADDGNVSIEASDQASLEMLDGSLTQDGTNGTGASMVSLWQTGMLGLKAEREINWKRMRTAAVQYLSPVAYVPS